jgi:hypothetical protein
MVLQRGKSFGGIMTMIADNNVSKFNGTQSIQNAIAITVVLDLGRMGILSQTYQNLEGTDLSNLGFAPTDSFGVTIDEQRLKDETDLGPDGKAKIVNDLLFRPQDEDLATALRTLFDATGIPVVTKVAKVTFNDRRTDGLATVLRFKIAGGFVEP